MRSSAFVLSALTALLLFLAAPAQAIPLEYTLSDMTSEQEEIDDDLCAVAPCGTPASVLDATVTVELSGSDLKITVDNNTSGGSGAGDYDISEIWLNISGVTVNSVSPAGSGAGATSDGYDLAVPSTVDGYGTFSVGIVVHGDVNQNDDLITAGQQNVMIILGCSDIGGCAAASIVDTSKGKQVAAKFINGGAVYDEGPGNKLDGNDSAYGASGEGFPPIPEPGTAALLFVGLSGLLAATRRR